MGRDIREICETARAAGRDPRAAAGTGVADAAVLTTGPGRPTDSGRDADWLATHPSGTRLPATPPTAAGRSSDLDLTEGDIDVG